MQDYTGYFAALATAVIWSGTSILFTLSGKEVGAQIVNRTRLMFALLFVMLMHWIMTGSPLPVGADLTRWGWLGLSGIIGFVIGDTFLFHAYVIIGPRLGMLLMALAPVFSAALGWLLLDEKLALLEIAGIALTIGGVALVIFDRRSQANGGHEKDPRRYALGIVYGIGAAIGQATGLFTSKLGLQGDFPALTGTLIRVIVAVVSIWLLTLVQGKVRETISALKEHPRAVKAIMGGAFGGPFVGVWLSLIAAQRAPLGIASTLMGLSPVVLLPVGKVLYKEDIGVIAVAGTLAAIAGTAMLFM